MMTETKYWIWYIKQERILHSYVTNNIHGEVSKLGYVLENLFVCERK